MTDPKAIAEGESEREAQAVWRCAIGDATTAIDILKQKLEKSRRKAERDLAPELGKVADMIWAARSPAPRRYSEAYKAGDKMTKAVRALLEERDGR